MKLSRTSLSAFMTAILVFGMSGAPTVAVADPIEQGRLPVTALSEDAVAPEGSDAAVLPLATLLEESEPDAVAEVDEGTLYVTGEVLVSFAPDSTVSDAEAALSDSGVVPTENLEADTLVNQELVTVEIDDGTPVAQKIEELTAADEVVYAQPNYLYSFDYRPNDPVFNEATSRWWHLSDIDALSAWDVAKVGKTVRVATIDSGVKVDHLDLKNNLDLSSAYNTFTGVYGAAGAVDTLGHGTHVAGIITGQADNGIGIAGTSFNAELVPINVIHTSGSFVGKSTTADFIKGFRHILALGNVDIINISMGTYGVDPALKVAVEDVTAKGIVIVGAGGNTNATAPSYPADYPSVISVTWYKSDGVINPLSDHGSGKNIAAPGTGVYSTVYSGEDAYGYMSGSSMASPVVAGVCALMLAANPDLTVSQVQYILYTTTNRVGSGKWDAYFGWGKVDASAAVLKALGVGAAQSTELSGSTRIETSIAIAQETYPSGLDGVIIVRSDDFPDALAASTLAGAKGYPIVLSSSSALSSAVAAYLATNPQVQEILLVGGLGSLSLEVETSVAAVTGKTPQRIAGIDRYDTARLLRSESTAAGATSDSAVIVRGEDFPDALSASPFCAATGAKMFLMEPSAVPDAEMLAELQAYRFAYVIGGYGSVSVDVDPLLASRGITVKRLAGGLGDYSDLEQSRYGTSAAISEWLVFKSGAGFSYDGAAFATGRDFPDALSGAPLCGESNSPVLLIDEGSTVTAEVAAASRQVSSFYWLGSINTLPASLRSTVMSLLNF